LENHFGLLRLEKELSKFIECRFSDPAFGALSGLAGANQASARQLLEMMRYGRLTNAQSLAEFAYAQAGALLRIAAMLLAASRKTKKNFQPVRVSQGLESDGSLPYIHISIVIDI
jgi:hypothetical protein